MMGLECIDPTIWRQDRRDLRACRDLSPRILLGDLWSDGKRDLDLGVQTRNMGWGMKRKADHTPSQPATHLPSITQSPMQPIYPDIHPMNPSTHPNLPPSYIPPNPCPSTIHYVNRYGSDFANSQVLVGSSQWCQSLSRPLSTFRMLGLVFDTLLRRTPWTPAQLTTLPLLGSTSLDQALEGPYQLLIQVKDMGDQASGHQATATIDVSIVENTWVPLDPVHVAENLKIPYPHHIAQVSKWLSEAEAAQWNVRLSLSLMEIWGVGLGPA